eukprot:jgi/Mesen1/9677/ME000680S09090
MYSSLEDRVRDGPIKAALGASELQAKSPAAAVEELLRSLLQGNTKVGDASAAIDSRVHDRMLLLDNPAGQAGAAERARTREQRARARRSARHMSLSQHRRARSFDLPPHLQNNVVLHSRLLTADLHGAILEAKDPVQVARRGIVVRETARTFYLLTVDDALKMVPKQGTVFVCVLETLQVTLFGSNLMARNVDTMRLGAQIKAACNIAM